MVCCSSWLEHYIDLSGCLKKMMARKKTMLRQLNASREHKFSEISNCTSCMIIVLILSLLTLLSENCFSSDLDTKILNL